MHQNALSNSKVRREVWNEVKVFIFGFCQHFHFHFWGGEGNTEKWKWKKIGWEGKFEMMWRCLHFGFRPTERDNTALIHPLVGIQPLSQTLPSVSKICPKSTTIWTWRERRGKSISSKQPPPLPPCKKNVCILLLILFFIQSTFRKCWNSFKSVLT